MDRDKDSYLYNNLFLFSVRGISAYCFFCNQPNIPRQAIVLKLGIIYLQFAPVAQLG